MIDNIIQNLLFLRLKEVIENNGYHDHETVYDHLIKTKSIAIKEITGDFIINEEAKALFLKFINEDFHGMKRSEIMILIALLHDVGKILYVKDNRTTHPLMVTDSSGITLCPGHEYWGSTIVERFLNKVSLQPAVITYISNAIRLHDTFSEAYFIVKKDWPFETLINDVKSRAEGFYKEVLYASFNGAEGIILDLRNNPGGFLEVAINLAGWFVNKGEIVVSEKFRNGTGDVFRADGNQALKDAPVVILVNKGSASASEILAGALRAIRGTKLIGTNTFGKGTVQELRSLSDNSKIKLTIANWVLPDGNIISEEGLAPDYEVKVSDEDIRNKFDSQLEKAKEVLLREMTSK